MLSELIADFSATFLDPRKRVFIGYLFSAFVIGLLWLAFMQRQTLRESLNTLTSSSIWWSASAKLDYGLFLLNKVVMLMLAPALLTQLTLASAIFYGFYEFFGERPVVLVDLPDWLVMLGFTGVYFLLDDFARFYVHRLMHRIPYLWAFHSVHHSATSLNPITIFRTHPVEGVIFALRSALVQGVVIGVFVFFLGDRIDLVTIFGANIFMFLFNLAGSNLRHSPIAIHYCQGVEAILLSPAQHQIHHSTAHEHFDKNFGVVLAIWDRLYGSHHFSEKNTVLNYGLGEDAQTEHTLFNAYIKPCVDCARVLAVDACRFKQYAVGAVKGFDFNGLRYRHDVLGKAKK